VRAAATAAEAARDDAAEAAAQEAVGALAAQQYRDGGPPQLAGFEGLLTARDPRGAELAAQAAQGVAEQARGTLEQAVTAAATARAADAAAQQANRDAAEATAKVAAARAAAQQQLAAQQAQVAALDAQHTTLLAGLATAQRVALQLAEARAQALAAQAARLAALAALAKQQAAAPAPRPGDVSSVLAFARSALGLPYVWGGAGPNDYDCSGLTMRAWQRAGVDLPHFAADQYADSHPIGYRDLQPGDLVFWSHDGTPQGIYHVALYTGDDTIIEAPRTGDVVKTASLWIMGTPDYYARP
jgi:cell wall-associated NlpC family hydrolase